MKNALKVDVIKRNTTAELVIEKILERISSGQLKVGDRLPSVQELTGIFGVGRSSIREAVRALGVLGYLEILPGKGTFIKENEFSGRFSVRGLHDILESGTIFDIMEARECLECECARLAAERVEPLQLKKIEKALRRMEEVGEDLVAMSKADLELHLLLAEASGNDVIYEIMRLLIEKVEYYADKFWATLTSSRERAVSTISQVVLYVADGEAEKAAQSMSDHLGLVKDTLKEVIKEDAARRDSTM